MKSVNSTESRLAVSVKQALKCLREFSHTRYLASPVLCSRDDKPDAGCVVCSVEFFVQAK